MTNELCQNYASALYDLLQKAERERALEAFSCVLDNLSHEEEFSKLLRSYSVSPEEKRRVLDAVYGKRFADIPHFVTFLKVVSDHHRIKELPDIYIAFRSRVHEDLGVKEGLAYSAVSLDDQQLEAVAKAIEMKIGCKVSLTNIVDHNLLGGVKVAIDGKVFDGSLSSKLEGLHRKLQGGIPS